VVIIIIITKSIESVENTLEASLLPATLYNIEPNPPSNIFHSNYATTNGIGETASLLGHCLCKDIQSISFFENKKTKTKMNKKWRGKRVHSALDVARKLNIE
jgi:hypothetical protein